MANSNAPQQMMLVQLGDGRLALCPVVMLQGNQLNSAINVLPSTVQVASNNMIVSNPAISNTNTASFLQTANTKFTSYDAASRNVLHQQGNVLTLNTPGQLQASQTVQLVRTQPTNVGGQAVNAPCYTYLPTTHIDHH